MKTAEELGAEVARSWLATRHAGILEHGLAAMITAAIRTGVSDAVTALGRFDAYPEPARGMLLALLADRLDASVGVLADWLEENGRTAEGAAVRRLEVKAGDLLVCRAPRDAAWTEAAALLRRVMSAAPPGVRVTMAPEGASVDSLPPDVLASHGWVRVEEAARQVEAEREAIAALCEGADRSYDAALGRELAAAIRARGQAPAPDGEAALTAVDDANEAPPGLDVSNFASLGSGRSVGPPADQASWLCPACGRRCWADACPCGAGVRAPAT